jgi:hypothetical protein
VLTRAISSQHDKLAWNGTLDSLKWPPPLPRLRIPRKSKITMQISSDNDGGW